MATVPMGPMRRPSRPAGACRPVARALEEGTRPLDPGAPPTTILDPVAAVLRARRLGRPLVLTTSGSTGAARSVVRSTDSWWLAFPAYSRLTGVTASATVWIPGPLEASMNLFAAVHATVVGAQLTPRPEEATHACLTPTQLHRHSAVLRGGTRVCVAGAALPARDAGPNLVHYYGSAELSFVAAGRHVEDLVPFEGVEVQVRNDEVWARSPYLCTGYGDGQPGPLRTDKDGWATVGDRGAWDGDRLAVLGRPGAVTTAGATVYLAEVEARLSRVASGPIAVYGRPHPTAGEVVAVAVVREQDVATLRSYARTHLPPAQRPRHWRVVTELPSTPAGKVDAARLVAESHG